VNGKTYSVRVRAYVNGAWGTFDQACTLMTPANTGVPVTKISTLYCGATLATSTSSFSCDPVSGATNYQYEITDMSNNAVTICTRNSSSNSITLNYCSVPLAVNFKTYSIRVKAYVGGVWGNFDQACTIMTPQVEALTKISSPYCGSSVSASSAFYCDVVSGATNYQYEITDLSNNAITIANRGSFSNSMTFAYAGVTSPMGKSYSIRVKPFVGGAWNNFGTVCTLSVAAARLMNPRAADLKSSLTDLVTVDIFPNPTSDVLNLKLSEEITDTINIMDLTGRVINSVKTTTSLTTFSTEDLSAGTYIMNITSDKGSANVKFVVVK
jgi:major membrane immunogen (membrane-anchored lipoprotein)